MKQSSIIAAMLIFTSLSTWAGTKTWVGGGGDKYWNNVGNWDVNAAPVDGDTVVFNHTTSGKSTNNLAGNPGLTLHLYGGNHSFYSDGSTTLHLNEVELNYMPQTNTFYTDIKLDTNVLLDVSYTPDSIFAFEGDVNLGIYTLTVTNSVSANTATEFSGVIKGSGDFVKQGAGTVTLSGTADNTFSGSTTVAGGTLFLDKALVVVGKIAVPGELVITGGLSTVSYGHSGQIADTSKVTVDSGLLDLNGYNDTIKSLVLLDGGDVMTDSGTLTIKDFINCPDGSSSIMGELEFDSASSHTINLGYNSELDYASLTIDANISGGGGIIKTGGGTLTLAGTNTFSGNFTNAEGKTFAYYNQAFGPITNLVVVTNGWLSFNGTYTNNLLLKAPGSIGGSGKWAGNITNINTPAIALTSTNPLTLSGVIHGSGFSLNGVVSNVLSLAGQSANTYTGAVTIYTGTLLLAKNTNTLAITGPLVIGDGVDFGDPDYGAAVVRLIRPDQISDTVAISILSDGTLDVNGQSESVTNLTMFGNIATGSGVLTLLGDVTADRSFGDPAATITGTLSLGNSRHSIDVDTSSARPQLDLRANIISTGANGGFTKEGSGELWLSGTNTHAGLTTLAAGRTLVFGTQVITSLTVQTNAELGGTGVVGVVTNYGTLFPGDYNSPTGAVFTAGNVLSANGKFAFDFGTLGSTNHDVLIVNALLMTNTALEIFDRTNVAISVGSSQILVTRTAGGAFGGTFTGVPDNSGFSSTNRSFLASYQAGNGNDFALTPYVRSSAPATNSQLVSLGNGGYQFNASGGNGVLYALLTSTNLTWPMTNWSVVTNLIPSGGNLQVRLTNTVTRPQQFYRLRTF